MLDQIANKNQLRAQETLERLLDAAETIFVRDGYDGAQLAEIAAAAGRSKGALYGHFKSKEDLFLALFEHRTQSYIDRFRRKIENCSHRQQRLEALREFYVECANDRPWSILTLEFKLYSLRHPESKLLLQKALTKTLPATDKELFGKIFGKPTQGQKADVELAILALGPILSGLVLESHFEPEQLTDQKIQKLLGKLFDAMFAPQK
jgi:AcrR family transcriptional regulator